MMTSDMKLRITSIAVFALVSLIIALTLSPLKHKQSVATEKPAAAGSSESSRTLRTTSSYDSGVNVSQSISTEYGDKYRHSHNYLEFARSSIDAANAGDVNAQYYLGKALMFCSDTGGPYHAYFQKKGRIISLDEALQNSAAAHRSNGYTQSIYDRCHDLREHGTEFGTASDWLSKAADAGQPSAESVVALSVMSDEAFKLAGGSASLPPEGSSASPTIVASATPPQTDKMADARAQLLAALQTKDPQAIWEAGEMQGFLNQSFSDKVKNMLAWRLVSCQRGLDCGPDADWVQLDCRVDSYCTFGTSGVDYIRNAAVAESDLPAVEQRAQDINGMLDAGAWDQLGIGP